MGFTRVTIDIGDIDPGLQPPRFRRKENSEVLVDTGATYTTLPLALLQKYGVREVRKVALTLADGRTVERSMGYTWIAIQDILIHTPVVFGINGDPPLLGVIALEDANFTVDPVTRQLVKRQSYIQY